MYADSRRHCRKNEEPGERVYKEAAEDVIGCVGGSMRTEEPGERVYEEAAEDV